MGDTKKLSDKEKYLEVIKSGMMSELYPSLTQIYESDKYQWKRILKKERKAIKIDISNPEEIAFSENKTEMKEEGKKFLLDYIRTHSPSGCEFEAQDVWTKYVSPFVDKIDFDSHGNAVAIKRSIISRFKLMIEAHCDEISYIITKIDPNGLIYVSRNGGSDEAIAPSKKVLIHVNNDIKVPAIFGWIAIHIRESHIKPDRTSIFLDGGFNNADEVKAAGVQVGQYVTYDEEPVILNDKLIGKSLDNKVGGYVIAQVMKKLQYVPLNIEVLASNSVQEEVGLHGASMVVYNHKPNVVIVTDVCHDTSTPGITNKLIGDITIGKGPVIVKGAAINGRLNAISEASAKLNKTDYQVMACNGRGTGTDADAFTYANGGTPTMLIKMPLRYMHTTVEMCSIKDINEAIELMYNTIIAINDTPGMPWMITNDFTNDI